MSLFPPPYHPSPCHLYHNYDIPIKSQNKSVYLIGLTLHSFCLHLSTFPSVKRCDLYEVAVMMIPKQSNRPLGFHHRKVQYNEHSELSV